MYLEPSQSSKMELFAKIGNVQLLRNALMGEGGGIIGFVTSRYEKMKGEWGMSYTVT